MDTKTRSLAFSRFACLIIALIAIVVFLRLLSTNSSVVYSMNLKDRESVKQAVDAAISNPRAVIYVNVDWSITAVIQREEFERLATDWKQTRPALPVSFHCIDFTSISDYSPLKSLPGWTEILKQDGLSPFVGNGELVWVANGRMVDVGRMDSAPISELIDKTDRLFAESDGDAASAPKQ